MKVKIIENLQYGRGMGYHIRIEKRGNLIFKGMYYETKRAFKNHLLMVHEIFKDHADVSQITEFFKKNMSYDRNK